MKLPLQNVIIYILFCTIAGLFLPARVQSQTVDYGKSYINITKGANGGTMETGDTLQIKATFVVKSGTLDSCGFFDNIPAGTTYIPGSLAVLTNEGKIYKAFTDAAGDDCGWVLGSVVRINLGYNFAAGKQASAVRRGQIKNTDRPSFYGSTCIMVASYKIKIIAPLGSQINVGGGFVTSKSGASPITTNTFPIDNVAIFTNYGLCSNSVGTNAIGTEFNGTFGSGKNKDRGTSPNVPPSYTYANFASAMPQDYYYGISNNTSTAGAGYSTVNTWPKPDPSATSHRVFTVWDIIGDHTGAAVPSLGNPASDTVNNNNGGYMLVINSSYRIDSAFKQTISGLCPNTYYEFSLWIRNICSKCGCDSNGKGATSVGYIPTAPGDSSGVHPNLTFAINSVDYYTSGDLPYNGLWIKKGFTYLTGPTETSFTAMIRNNAPGGGGNDWAIDDISIATCTPNLTMNPSPNVNVCFGNQVDMSAVISCFFPNYIYWQWEKSTDGGSTWTNTGVSGTGTPTLVGANWQYTATYPTFLADSSVHNNLFRIKIASTPGNLSDPNCSFTASTLIRVWVNNCSFVLPIHLLSFTGRTENNVNQLVWTTENETATVQYDLERSTDGVHFASIGVVPGTAGSGNGGTYTFNDPYTGSGAVYYRIKMKDGPNYQYSRIITLNAGLQKFEVTSTLNPFDSYLSVNINTPMSNNAQLSLYDSFGRLVKIQNESLTAGPNKVVISGLGSLSDGHYILSVKTADNLVNKQVIKVKN